MDIGQDQLDIFLLKKRPEFDFPSKLDEDLIPDKKDAAAETADVETGTAPAPDDEPAAETTAPETPPEDEPKE